MRRFFAWLLLASGLMAAAGFIMKNEGLQLCSLPLLFIAVVGMGLAQLASHENVSSSHG